MPKLKLNKEKIKRFFWLLGEKAFLFFVIFSVVCFLVALLIFYFYAYLPLHTEPVVEVKEISVNDKLFDDFVKNYTQRKEKFYKAGLETLEDPFYGE